MSDVDVDEGARLRHIAENDLRARRVAETELAAERNRGVKYPLIQRQLPNEKDRNYFLHYASNKTSQCGEDGILDHLFGLLGVPADGGRGYCVDIGAWDGKHLSNTYTLVHERGWGGLLVEADAARAQVSVAWLLHGMKVDESPLVTCICTVAGAAGALRRPR